ncbi:MAG: RHS repeat protein, partial [Silvibacterium sp.]|nr:RHS repeat protein [Silvibacterium sp.]
MGRPLLNTLPNGAQTANGYTYNGQVCATSNPSTTAPPANGLSCAASQNPSPSSPTDGITYYYYDALGRPTVQTQPDGSMLEWCYNGVVSTLPSGAPNICSSHLGGVLPDTWVDCADETGRKWQRTYDAIGHLTEVMEPDGSSTIGKTPSLETDYWNDALGNVVKVNQWGGSQSSSGVRTRIFTYDGLSRLITASNPESGTVCYGTWSGSTCINGYDSDGNLVKKTDARGVVTTYAYDTLNRLTRKSYSDGTLAESYGYDGNDETGKPRPGVTNAVGRRSHSSNEVNIAADYSYDPVGRMISRIVCVPGNCNYVLGAAAKYDLAGDIVQSTLAQGLNVVMSYDSAGRLNSVTIPNASPAATIWSNPTYGPFGATSGTLGNGLQEQTAYDKRGRITSYQIPSRYSYSITSYATNSNVLAVTDSVNGSWT